jgi:hypothetical protein
MVNQRGYVALTTARGEALRIPVAVIAGPRAGPTAWVTAGGHGEDYMGAAALARILPGLEPPLRGRKPEEIRMLFVRENTEGEYCGLGGRFKLGTEDEVAIQQSVFTRKGVERVMRYAFQLACRRPRKRLASAT